MNRVVYFMLSIIFVVLVVLTSNAYAVEPSKGTMVLPYVSTLDGDTVRTYVSLPEPLNKLSIRINGIDTPESTWRAKCDEELIKGIEAKAYLVGYLADVNLLYVRNFKYGKYAGRILGDVYVKKNDVLYSLADVMTKAGYTKPYDGKKKPNWCE